MCLCVQMPGRFDQHGNVRPSSALPAYAFERDADVLVCALWWEEQTAWASVARREKDAGEIRVKSYSSLFKVFEPDAWKQRRCEVAHALGSWVQLQLEMAGTQRETLRVVCEEAHHHELLPYTSSEDGRACTIAYALRSSGAMEEGAFNRMRVYCDVLAWASLLTRLVVAAS